MQHILDYIVIHEMMDDFRISLSTSWSAAQQLTLHHQNWIQRQTSPLPPDTKQRLQRGVYFGEETSYTILALAVEFAQLIDCPSFTSLIHRRMTDVCEQSCGDIRKMNLSSEIMQDATVPPTRPTPLQSSTCNPPDSLSPQTTPRRANRPREVGSARRYRARGNQ